MCCVWVCVCSGHIRQIPYGGGLFGPHALLCALKITDALKCLNSLMTDDVFIRKWQQLFHSIIDQNFIRSTQTQCHWIIDEQFKIVYAHCSTWTICKFMFENLSPCEQQQQQSIQLCITGIWILNNKITVCWSSSAGLLRRFGDTNEAKKLKIIPLESIGWAFQGHRINEMEFMLLNSEHSVCHKIIMSSLSGSIQPLRKQTKYQSRAHIWLDDVKFFTES